MSNVSIVYFGERDNMLAEVGAWNPLSIGISKRECKYLVMADGDAQFDTEWFSSRKEAKAYAREIASHYSAKICAV